MLRKPCSLVICFSVLFIATLQLEAVSSENCLLFSITSQNTARLGIINAGKRSLDLTVFNRTGEVYFMKTVRGESNFFQLLDLTNMPDGYYTVKLSDGAYTSEKRFSVINSTARIIRSEEEAKPRFFMPDQQTLVVSYFNTYMENVNIFIMRNDEVVFEDRGLSDMTLSKKYSLRQLPSGEYTVKLYSGGKIFSYSMLKN